MNKQFTYIRKFVISFAIIFTCVTIVSAIFISLYSNPYLPVKLIIQSGIIAAIASLLNFIYYSEKPINKKSMVIRTIIHFILLLTTVCGCAFYYKWLTFNSMKVTLTFLGLFIAVYIFVWMINFCGDIIDEKILNIGLKEYSSKQK